MNDQPCSAPETADQTSSPKPSHKSRNANYAYADTPLKVEPPVSVGNDPLLRRLQEGHR